jgi:hypothetical protein
MPLNAPQQSVHGPQFSSAAGFSAPKASQKLERKPAVAVRAIRMPRTRYVFRPAVFEMPFGQIYGTNAIPKKRSNPPQVAHVFAWKFDPTAGNRGNRVECCRCRCETTAHDNFS